MTYDPNNPSMRDPMPPRRGDSNAGWIAGVIIVVLVIIGLFYWGGSQQHTASNAPSPATSTSRPTSPMSPPSTTGSGTTSPSPAKPSPASPPTAPGK